MSAIQKTIQSRQECYIQFTEEEMEQLNIAPGDKFTWKLKDGGIMLEKHVPVEIDLESWDKEILIELIHQSCEKDISVNEVITEILEKYVDKQQ